jgi:tRNA dimethylallyltransferase
MTEPAASPRALPRALALAGPTASGKTAAAMALAEVCRAQGGPALEIISVDSALVYRGMDIGTAKPSAAERAAVPHHLIDIRDPHQPYSAAEFVADARSLIDAIHARGALPLLVGGTMLYFKALFDGLDDIPAADAGVRKAIDAKARERGWPALHAELARVDPATAARLAPGDAQRIQRALEVWQVSGRPLSSFHSGRFDAGRQPNPDFALISLEPTDRAWLHTRIAARFDAMLAAGFLDEVRTLRDRGDLHPDLPSMRCVGYRQAWEMLDGLWPASEFVDRGVAATRQLAKRQITWLRGMPWRLVVACDRDDATEAVVDQALPQFQRMRPCSAV